MKKLALFLAGLFLVTGLAGTAQAYDEDMHFYMVYWMAKKIGFNQDERSVIAASNQRTDTHELTDPTLMNPLHMRQNDNQRRLWHFPAYLKARTAFGKEVWRSYDDTRQNSYYGLYNVIQSQGSQGKSHENVNGYFMGMSLHTYMDTYSHEGYAAEMGHTTGGYDVDRPHLYEEKTKKMLDKVYTQLINYGIAKGSGVLTAATFENARKSETKKAILEEAWEIIDSYDKSIDNRDETVKKDLAGFRGKHEQVVAKRNEVWRDLGSVERSYDYAGDKSSYTSAQWEEKALGKYDLPHHVKELKGFDDLPVKFAANTYSTPESMDFFTDFCDVPDEERAGVIFQLLTEKSRILINPTAYSDTYAKQLDCAEELVATPEGLKILMDYVADDGSGVLQKARNYLALRMIPAVAWSDRDIEDVVLPYLESEHKDARLLAAWVAFNYKLERSAVLEDIFSAALEEELKTKGSDEQQDGQEGSGRVVDFLPITPEFVRIWQDVYQKGSSEEESQAAFALYTISTSGPQYEASNSFSVVDGIMLALKIIQAGSGRNASDDNDGADYWRIRSYEDIDDNTHNSATDQAHIGELAKILDRAVQSENISQIQAAAIAASSFSPDDGVTDELKSALASAFAIKDPAVQAEVGYALQQVTGQYLDLSKDGLETLDEKVEEIIR